MRAGKPMGCMEQVFFLNSVQVDKYQHNLGLARDVATPDRCATRDHLDSKKWYFARLSGAGRQFKFGRTREDAIPQCIAQRILCQTL